MNKLILHIVCCLNQAFADAVSILEKELFEASATDVSKGEDSFNLLQKIIPSFVGKWRCDEDGLFTLWNSAVESLTPR